MGARLQMIRVLVLAERKKAGMLVGLGAVLTVLVARTMFDGSPSRASAGGAESDVGSSQRAGVITMDELRLDGPVVAIESPGPVERNVFGFDARHFPIPRQSAPSSEVEQKSGAEEVESPRADAGGREALERLVREEAGMLRLKSTLMGPNPMAVIESRHSRRVVSRTLRPGDGIEGFRLLSVESRAVVLEKHGVRIELER